MGHFFTFSVGDVAVVASLLITYAKVQLWINVHNIEHEMLIAEYLKRNNMQAHELPTRTRRR